MNEIVETARKKNAIKEWRKKFLPWQREQNPEPNPLKELLDNEKTVGRKFTGR